MKKSRLVWLGAFVALMAMLGTSALSPQTADAATASIQLCKVGTGNVVGQNFTFNVTGGGAGLVFVQQAGAVGTPVCQTVINGANITGPLSVAIQEQIPANARVANITVTGGSAGAITAGPAVNTATGSVAFTVADGSTGTITVTYTNEPCTGNCPVPPTGTTVTVNKVCVGAAIGATFGLNVGGAGGTTFPGILCGGTTGAVAVTPGTQITAGEPTIPAGFAATVSCTGATNPTSGTGANAGVATFTPTTGQTIVCTVTNTATAAAIAITPQSKICVQYQPIANVLDCSLSTLFPQGFPGGAVVDVTIAGANIREDGNFVSLELTGCPGATVTRVSSTVFRITAPAGGCAPGTVIVVSEKLNCETTNTITQTLRLRTGVDGTLLDTRTITATGPGGQPLTICTTTPIVNPVISGATKICRPYTPVAGVLECDLSLPLASPGGIPAGARVEVTLSPASAAAFRQDAGVFDVVVVAGCPGATIIERTANSFVILAPASGCPFPATVVVSQKINCITNITPGLLSETVLVRNAQGTVIGTAAPGLVVPFTGPGGQPLSFPCQTGQNATATKSCAPVINGVPAPSGGQTFTRVGQVVTCTVTITNTAASQVSPAGNVQVTLSNASFIGAADSAVTVTNINAGGTVGTIPCAATAPAAGGLAQCTFTESFVAGPNACTTISQTITSITGGPFSFVFSPLTVGPSSPSAPVGNTIFVLPKDESGIVCPGQVTGFAGNDLRFVLRCTTAGAAALGEFASLVTGVIPGPIGGSNVLALGILPQAVLCEAGFLATGDAATAPFRPAAPGTIEASSLNGTLVDLRGGITTNLRIGCGTGATVNLDNPIGVTVDVNTCLGVRFAVIGLGVGLTELRARYEPSSAAAAAGIREREASGSVAFIAPATAVSLLLNPNPVGVGATGTATARFNRTSVFSNELLINPSTGAPLFVNLGTPLNGTVTFTSSAPQVASFTGSGIQSGDLVTGINPGTSAGLLITGGGSSVTVRCGSATPVFAGSGVPQVVTAASFSSFFGGCTEASAAYRGNAIGITTITATFNADLPFAFGGVTASSGTIGSGQLGGLFDQAGNIRTNSASANLEVVQLAATTQRLVPGCNNVVAVANETPAQVAARVDPTSAVISVFRQVPGTTMFLGSAIGQAVPAGVNNLPSVNALDAIFICVNAAATYRIA